MKKMREGGNKKRSKFRKNNKRSNRDKRGNKSKKGGKTQNWEKNKGYFGPIMDKKGKLDRDEICHNCSQSAYSKKAREFCKLHNKVWDPKTNSCKSKKKKKTKKRKKTRMRSKRKKN